MSPARDIPAERASVRVGERVGSWSARGLYSLVIFNHPPLAYYSFPPVHSGSTFGSVSCSRAARFKQNQRMIALSLSNPPAGKKRRGGGQKCFTEKAGTRHGCDIQRAGFSPAPISEKPQTCLKKKKQHGWKATPPLPTATRTSWGNIKKRFLQ